MGYRRFGGKKIYLFAAALGLSLFLCSLNNPGKVLAYSYANNSCGVDGTIHDYAGLVVGFGVSSDSGTPTGYGSVTVRVNTAYPSYQNQNNSDNPSGNGYYNLVNNSDGSLTNGATFNAKDKGSNICGVGTRYMAILGNLNPTADTNNKEWQLDCDFSIRAESGGPKYNTSTKYQEFGIFPSGTPDGLRGGGFWTVDSGSYNANGNTADTANTGHIGPSNTQRIGPANGGTGTIVFIYHELVKQCTTCNCPGQPACPINTGDLTCYSDAEKITAGSLAANQRLHVFVYDSQHPLTVDSADNATSTVLASGFIFASGDRWSSSLFNPLGQTVTQHVVSEIHTVTSTSDTWSYSTYGSDVTTGGCYSAECYFNSVSGDLPGGYIKAGGTVYASVTIYNDSPSGITLPGNTGDGSQYLGVLSTGADSAGFSNISPAYTGPIPYPNALSGDTSKTQTFTTTVTASGTLYAHAGYANGGFGIGGADCSTPISVYQPPIENIDGVACAENGPPQNGNLSGWAFDPYYTDSEINVEIYVDGPGPGQAGTTDLGAIPTDQPRPDVNSYPPFAGYGLTGNHGFSYTIPTAYQDGQNHTFYVIAKDPNVVEDSAAQSKTMTGCEKFHLQPGANGGKLSPAPEAPTSFDGNATITVTYHNGATSTDSSTYGPGPGNYSGYPGVPTAANCPPAASAGCPSYTFTKNGIPVGSGSVGSGRFIDTTYTPTAVGIAPLTYIAGDTYCINVGADPIDGYIQNDGTILSVSNHGPDTQASCDTVTNRPFFKVYNGGVSAGGAFSATSGGSCSGGGSAGTLASWNNDTGVYPTVTGLDYGASAQLNALALKNIVGFASAQPPFGQSPTYLSFANTTNTTSDTYKPYLGGAFDAPANSYCLTDVAPPAGIINGNYPQPGTTVNPGTNTSVFVNGNVYILGNIVYAGAGWSLSNVPSFVLHATGNIYISPNVTELDGQYIAHGKIYTCADSSGFSPMAISNLYGSCNNQLTVYGNFVATQVNLMRTFGSLRDETPTPAVTSAAVSGATKKLDWSYAGKIPGETCTLVTEPSAPNEKNYTGPPTADLGWEDNYLCVPPSDGTGGQVQIGYTCDTYSNGNVNGCNTPASASSLPPPGLPDCTGSIGNAIAAPPWNYPSTTYAWQDNYICSNYPIRFVVSSSDPSSSTQFCTLMNEPWDTNGGDVWNKAAYACIDKGQVGTTTPASAHVASPCSNLGFQSSAETCAAEVFKFSPELYLSTPNVQPPGGSSAKWDAVTSLPPVL
jgi:hypothetical protein